MGHRHDAEGPELQRGPDGAAPCVPTAPRNSPGVENEGAPPSPASGAPRVRELTHEECEKILARNIVGRIAYSFRDRVHIEPVHYAYDAGWLYGRTSPSAKLDVLRHSRWVAFEVDEVDGLFDWRSVVAHGGFYVLEEGGSRMDRLIRQRAIQNLRRVIPATGTADDPVPQRDVLFRIHVDRMSGRAATSRDD